MQLNMDDAINKSNMLCMSCLCRDYSNQMKQNLKVSTVVVRSLNMNKKGSVMGQRLFEKNQGPTEIKYDLRGLILMDNT